MICWFFATDFGYADRRTSGTWCPWCSRIDSPQPKFSRGNSVAELTLKFIALDLIYEMKGFLLPFVSMLLCNSNCFFAILLRFFKTLKMLFSSCKHVNLVVRLFMVNTFCNWFHFSRLLVHRGIEGMNLLIPDIILSLKNAHESSVVFLSSLSDHLPSLR